MKIMATVGVVTGKSYRYLMARISIFSSSSSSFLERLQASALLSRLGMLILSCNSSRTADSILCKTSLPAIVLMFTVTAWSFVFLACKFFMFMFE